MKPFDKMNTTTARLFILLVLVALLLGLAYGSRFLYTGVQDTFEPGAAKLKGKKKLKKKKEEEEEEEEEEEKNN